MLRFLVFQKKKKMDLLFALHDILVLTNLLLQGKDLKLEISGLDKMEDCCTTRLQLVVASISQVVTIASFYY